MRSYGMPNSRWVSISSRPLLTSDAEFSVFIGPIDQVGCAPACSGVDVLEALGGPAAERAARRGQHDLGHLVGGAAPQALGDRRVLGVDGHELARFRGLKHQRSASDQRFLVRQGQPGAGGQCGQCRLQAKGSDERIEHDIGLGVLHERSGGVRARIGDVTHLLGGIGVGDGDVGDAGFGALSGQQIGVAAACGEADHLEAVRVGGDDVQRLGADRPGTAEDQHAQPVAHRSIVPLSGEQTETRMNPNWAIRVCSPEK